MRVGIVGSRVVGNFSTDKMFSHLPNSCSLIISGGALGIDSLAVCMAKDKNIPFKEIKPDYEFWGKQAPFVRNTQIVKESDMVLAFWDFQSRGTAHTISECIRLGVPIEIVAINQ